MYYWKLNQWLGFFPFPHFRYSNLIRTYLFFIGALIYSKYYIKIIYGQQLFLLQLILGTMSIPQTLLLIGIQNWSLCSNSKNLCLVLDTVEKSGLSDSMSSLFVYNTIEFIYNYAKYMYSIRTTTSSKCDDYCMTILDTEGVIYLITDVTGSLITSQFYYLLHSLSKALREQMPTETDLHKKANAAYNILERARDVDRMYGKQILVFFAINIHTAAYCSYLWAFLPNSPLHRLIYRITKVFYVFIPIFLITNAAESFRNEVKLFNHRLVHIVKANHYLRRDKMLCLYLNKQPNITFSASGFFPINNGTTNSMFAAVMAYLFAILQFAPR